MRSTHRCLTGARTTATGLSAHLSGMGKTILIDIADRKTFGPSFEDLIAAWVACITDDEENDISSCADLREGVEAALACGGQELMIVGDFLVGAEDVFTRLGFSVERAPNPLNRPEATIPTLSELTANPVKVPNPSGFGSAYGECWWANTCDSEHEALLAKLNQIPADLLDDMAVMSGFSDSQMAVVITSFCQQIGMNAAVGQRYERNAQ